MKLYEKTKDVKRNNIGITLIALVITIIVLLILAGVTISTLTGDNGILQKVSDAKNATIVAEEKEKIQLGYIQYKMNKKANEETTLTVQGADVTGDETNEWTITFTATTGNIYQLDSDGTIEEGGEIVIFLAKINYAISHQEEFRK